MDFSTNSNFLIDEADVSTAMIQRVSGWGFSSKIVDQVKGILGEWFSNNSLNGVLSDWERKEEIRSTQLIPLQILSYNVQGWGTRAMETIEMIFTTDSSICILTEVGELWNSTPIPHYRSYYQRGTNGKGGVVIAVAKHLRVTRIEAEIENTVIVDVDGLSEPIRVIGIYWPHCQVRNLEDLKPFLIERTIISGDFNAAVEEWNSPTTDTRGSVLRSWVERNSLYYIPSNKHTSKRSERNIDLFLTNTVDGRVETLEIGTSDHWPILMKCDQVAFQSVGMFQVTNWKVYDIVSVLLEEFWRKECDRTQIDEWYQNYTRFLAALKNRVTVWKSTDKYRPSLPPGIRGMLKEVRLVRNKYYRQKKFSPGEAEKMRGLLRSMTSQVRAEINRYKSERWSEFLTSIQHAHDTKGRLFWTHLSKIYKPRTLPLSKLLNKTGVVSDRGQIVTSLFEFFSEQASAPSVDLDNLNDKQIMNEYTELSEVIGRDSTYELEAISHSEISRLIRKMKNKKSAGYDGISNQMIKRLPPVYIECLVKCFNGWLRECRFPDCWKKARIIPLNKLKVGVPRCDQTRPISLLPTHSKLFEKVVLEQIRKWAEGNQLVPPEQSGFRPGGLLPTRALSIYQEISNSLAANTPTLAVYVDFRKAYDLVWHQGLVAKLRRLEMPERLLKMIMSWLKDRKAHVALGEEKSEDFRINVGLPQGSSLSPYLFIVYHSDMIRDLGSHSCHLFADDLCVLIKPPIVKSLASTIKYIQDEGERVCSKIVAYTQRWKQPINVQKTVGQLFYSQVEKPTIKIKIEGQYLEIVDQFRYLGFTWTSKLSLKPTVDLCVDKTSKAIAKLKWLQRGRRIDAKVLRKCFFAYVFPHLAWIFPFYPFLPKTHKENIDRKYRVGMRVVHRCPYVKANEFVTLTQEKPVEEYVKKYIMRRLGKAEKTDLGKSPFYEDIFYWDEFKKHKGDNLGHWHRLRRVKNLKKRHESLLLRWIKFIEKDPIDKLPVP